MRFICIVTEMSDTCYCATPQMYAAKLTVRSVFWLSNSKSVMDFDDIAVEGIFRGEDPKLCFYSYRQANQPAVNRCVRDSSATSARSAFPRPMCGE